VTGLPSWAVVGPERRAHIERVVGLLRTWGDALRVPAGEVERWTRAAWLHDALRDAPLVTEFAHGPMAAERAQREGERDRGVLDAVRYHSVGYAGWDEAGRMLYLADYLEPGRSFEREARGALAARVPSERVAVLREVAAQRISQAVRSGWELPAETVAFWNALVAG
jgi:HD superfamily phosphohydrolase YqeK